MYTSILLCTNCLTKDLSQSVANYILAAALTQSSRSYNTRMCWSLGLKVVSCTSTLRVYYLSKCVSNGTRNVEVVRSTKLLLAEEPTSDQQPESDF